MILPKPINDLTTTLEAPPRLPFAYSQKFIAIQRERYPDLEPFVSRLAPHALFAAAESLAQSLPGWSIVEKDGLRLLAVCTTPLMRFKDDVAVEVRPEAKGGSSLHMRSRSRIGRYDFGANAKRIRGFIERLKEEVGR